MQRKPASRIVFFGGLLRVLGLSLPVSADPVPGGTLDPTSIPKYQQSLPLVETMPKTSSTSIDYYEIAVKALQQQVLPASLPKTTLFGYGSLVDNVFTYPGRTFEATVNRPVRVKWINALMDRHGRFVPHFLPIDQTLHWANPPMDCLEDPMGASDCRGQAQGPYTGPVPIVTHLHGAHVGPMSDGYPEAWYLPDAVDIPESYARQGTRFGQIGGVPVAAGAATYEYPNDQRATTLWYHDHSLGMTRVNVYAGLAGFYILRGGASGATNGFLPGGQYEIPLLIQDRSFNADGSLFYPSGRAFFEGLETAQLDIPFIPDTALDGDRSDVSPIWNPEFFGNTMVVNGRTWPVLEVEKRRYRFRVLNGSDSRFLILQMAKGGPTARPAVRALSFWQIGADGGFLRAPAKLDELLIAPAERADVVVDFSGFPVGTELHLINVGPDEPFGGGRAPDDFDYADPGTTGQVMKLKVVARVGPERSTPPQLLALAPLRPLGPASRVRRLSLNEDESQTVCVVTNDAGDIVQAPCSDPDAVPFGPTSARLGTLDPDGNPVPRAWMDGITENPRRGATEIWEIYNFTADAHPIHIHLVQFEVLNRQRLVVDADGMSEPPARLVRGVLPPEPWERGTKDTVVAYPGQVTRLKARFDLPGLFVWHCHILSHEDNEMMRPYCVGTPGIDCPADLFDPPAMP